MEHPGLFDVVAEAGECPRPVVEEFLRWRGPVVNFRRTATEDHVLAGAHIRDDDKVLMLYPSANWGMVERARHRDRPISALI